MPLVFAVMLAALACPGGDCDSLSLNCALACGSRRREEGEVTSQEKSKIEALYPGVFKIGEAVKIRRKGSAAVGGLRSGTIVAVDKDFVFVCAGCDPGVTVKFPRDSASRFIYPAKRDVKPVP